MNTSHLIMPESVVLDEANYSNTFGRFSLQPLERGFGVALVNSLRRVLLSSLPGAAITSVKFSGILHEFTTIPGVVEDVSEIVLNLKQVRMKLLTKKPNKIDLSFNGDKVWTAADIQKASNEIEILNPDLHIATLNKSAKFDVEIRVGKGTGYVPAVENSSPDQVIGVIPIDSIFTPIRNVKMIVENVRIGDKNDFEKLTLEIANMRKLGVGDSKKDYDAMGDPYKPGNKGHHNRRVVDDPSHATDPRYIEKLPDSKSHIDAHNGSYHNPSRITEMNKAYTGGQ